MDNQNLTQTITASKHPSGVIKLRHASIGIRRRRDASPHKVADWIRNLKAWTKARQSKGFGSDIDCLDGVSASSPLGNNALFTKNPNGESSADTRTLKPMRSESKQALMDCVAVIENKFSRENCCCLTATCPGSSWQAVTTYAMLHTRITKNLKDWLSLKLATASNPAWLVYVLEFQKRKALHSHWALGLPSGIDIHQLREEAKREYFRILSRLSKQAGVDLFERESGGSWRNKWGQIADIALDLQPIKVSAVHYFAKYLSKGTLEGSAEIGTEFCATQKRFRWWGASRVVNSSRKAQIENRIISHVDLDVVQECVTVSAEMATEVGAYVVAIANPYTGENCGVNIYPKSGTLGQVWQLVSACFSGYFASSGDVAFREVQSLKFRSFQARAEARVRAELRQECDRGWVSGNCQRELLGKLRARWCSMPSVRSDRVPRFRIPLFSGNGGDPSLWRVMEYKRGTFFRVINVSGGVEKIHARITSMAVSGPGSIQQGTEKLSGQLQLRF